MHEQPTIRKAQPADATQISGLIIKVAHCCNCSPSGDFPSWFLASVTPAAVAENIGNPTYHYLVAVIGQTLAGVIAVRDTTHVYHLFVAPEFQRQGVAAKLWERAKTDAIALGNSKGFSVRSSEFAVPVYERFGFRIVGARAEKDGIVFVPMQLELQPEHDLSGHAR